MDTVTLREPKPAQVRAMQYAFPRSRIALFMQMRLGKNLVAIRWARHHELERVLVVAPNDALDDWQQELLLEGVPSGSIFSLTGSRLFKSLQAEEIDSGWALVNYEAVRGMRKKDKRTGRMNQDTIGADILQLPWSGIILDESTAIRTPTAQTTKTFLRYTGHILHRAILTGLPDPQSEMDYFSQLAFLNGQFMGQHNFWAWRGKHYKEPMGFGDWEWRPLPGTKEAVKAEVRKYAFFLSRKEAGVGEQRVVEKRHVDMTPRQKQLYKQVEKEFAFGDLETNWATTKTIWLARIAGGFSPDRENPVLLSNAKIRVLINLLQGELKGEPVVVWFRFNQELFAVSAALKESGIAHTKVTGGLPQGEPARRKKKFQEGKVNVILMQVTMGKFSWDLSRADTEIRFSETYDYEVFAQSRDRIVSVHKHVPLLSISLVTRDTVDEEVVSTLNRKGMNAKLFKAQLKETLAAAWRSRHPGSGRVIKHAERLRRVLPGDRL